MITSSRWKCEISDGAACRILSISLGRQTIACHASDKYCFEREDSFEDVQNCTDVFFTAVHLPAVVNSFMLTGDLRSLMCRAVVDVKYLPCSQDSCPDALHQCMKRNNETMFLMCDPCHRQCISRSEENISSRNSLK